MRSKAFTTCVGFLFCFTATAVADDLNPPPWRGEPLSTYQVWEFISDANPSLPDVYFNPYGTPSAFVEYNTPFVPWIPNDFGHQGVWYVEDWMSLFVPNSSVANPFKYVWVQLTYYADGAGQPQFFSVPGMADFEVINLFQLDDYYWHGTYLITIEPNPENETIYLMPRDCTIYVDQVVVDTICIPEPATLSLMALACLALFRRR